MGQGQEALFSVVPILFLVSVPVLVLVLVPCSVYEPLLRQILLRYKLTSMWFINFTKFYGFSLCLCLNIETWGFTPDLLKLLC